MPKAVQFEIAVRNLHISYQDRMFAAEGDAAAQAASFRGRDIQRVWAGSTEPGMHRDRWRAPAGLDGVEAMAILCMSGPAADYFLARSVPMPMSVMLLRPKKSSAENTTNWKSIFSSTALATPRAAWCAPTGQGKRFNALPPPC